MGIADNILDAVDILVEEKVSDLQFNKTIRGKIAEIVDASIGQYKIQYQNSYFTAYASDSNARYSKNSDVYVEILSNDFERNALILGTVRRLGSNYITIVEKLDKYTEIGEEFTDSTSQVVKFSSYKGSQSKQITWKPDSVAVAQAVQNADSIKLGMHIVTDLAMSQQTQGNYGLQVIATYYDEAQREDISGRATLDRLYVFDINNMVGQPYRYVGSGSDQYAIFPIDAKNFKELKSITAFCEGFPEDSTKKDIDIILSNFSLQFLKELTEEELNGSFLSINAYKGNYFLNDDAASSERELVADLRIKGKKVNYNSQAVDFYWFRTNLSIHPGDEKFSPYGGIGWERLNTTSLNVYKWSITKSICTGVDTKFKCVAVFTEGGQTTSVSNILHIKIINGIEYIITSSAGNNFSFNVGTTNLSVNKKTNGYYYCWTYSLNRETPIYIDSARLVQNKHTLENVTIANPATNFVIYECSIYNKNKTLLGTASITLMNNKENAGCTLVINNGTQIFKYDTYGTSPASQAVAAADRMIIPTLSFDIYDKQGNLIEIPDNQKTKYMKIRWFWPTDNDPDNHTIATSHILNLTMLTCNYTLQELQIPNIQTGTIFSYPGMEDQPTFTYGIRDMYQAELANTTAAHNNIRLEVDYQGEHLVASTNFTFTKEGELGTNGTKYVARITPKNYDEIILKRVNSETNEYEFYGVHFNPTGNQKGLEAKGKKITITNLFNAELWDGQFNIINQASSVTWKVASSTARNGSSKQRIKFSDDTTVETISGTGKINSNIIQVDITYQDKKFYATYPIPLTTNTGGTVVWLQNGYKEVMYESDGSRGRFIGLPFSIKRITSTGLHDAFSNSTTYTYENEILSGGNLFGQPQLVENNQYTIEPPSYFISEQINNYIQLNVVATAIATQKESTYTTYFPIELYLNRYGMSAMNDWDGNSIQVDKDGKGYILAPQVGAGRKESDNSFTGITIGEVFQDSNNKEIGMFGYYQGARSLFLDAKTGDAEFGITGKGQIKIHASDGEGTIDSGDYSTSDKTGLKIKFTSTGSGNEKGPYIKYGSGNFSVNSSGHLTAKGGGSVAGWEIADTYLRSPDTKTYLYSNNSASFALDADSSANAYTGKDFNEKSGKYDKDVDVHWNDRRKTRLAISNRFLVNEDGAFKSTAGLIGGWRIGANTLQSRDGKTTLYSTYHKNDDGTDNNNGLRVSIGNGKFAVYQDGRFKAANDKFTVAADGTIKATAGTVGGWTLGDSSLWANNRNLVLLNSGDILGPDARSYLGHNDDYSFNVSDYLNGNISFYTDFDNTLRVTLKANPTLGTTQNYNGFRFKSNKNNQYYQIVSDPFIIKKENGKNVKYYRHKVVLLGSTFESFTPYHRKWEITNNGVAYFTDVKIRNTTGAENSLNWSTPNGDNIFKLTDTGSQIGGWFITGNELTSGDISITSGTSGTDNTVISVNNALSIYGNGDIDTNGSLNAQGGGTIGGASFGIGGTGTVSFPAGIMYFGGKEVSLQGIPAVTGVTISEASLSEYKDEEVNVSIESGQKFDATFTGSQGSVTIDGKTGYFTPSGTVSITSPTMKVKINLPTKITLKGHFDGKVYEAMTTADYNSVEVKHYNMGNAVTSDV